MSAFWDWLRRKTNTAPFLPAIPRPALVYPTPAYPPERVPLMDYHHGQTALHVGEVPGLTTPQRQALIAAIYADVVIDLYQHAAGDWVIELNHFADTPGFCCPPWGQFLLTPERWAAVYLDLAPHEWAESEAVHGL